MDYSIFNGLFDFLAQFKDWGSFFFEVLKLLPGLFTSMWSIIIISIVIIGLLIFIFKLIG